MTTSRRKRGKRPTNPSDVPPPNEETQRVEHELQRQYDAQGEAKRSAGRYTLDEAADALASEAGERRDLILAKLTAAVEEGTLPTHEPGHEAKLVYGAGDGRMRRVRTFHDEVYADDLNRWLAEHELRVPYRFRSPKRPVQKEQPHKRQRMDALARIVQEAMRDGCASANEVRRWIGRMTGTTVDGVEIESVEGDWLEGWDQHKNEKVGVKIAPRKTLKDRVSRYKRESR